MFQARYVMNNPTKGNPMSHFERAKLFHQLHLRDNPLVLYNVWDVATAKAAESAGAKALATGSWSIAAAHGYEDGQKIPFEFMTRVVERIVSQTDLPVSMDFEAGFSTTLEGLAENFQALIDIGVVGVNFEDQIIGGDELYSVEDQVERLKTLRTVADKNDIPMFINARTDVFLKSKNASTHSSLVDTAIERGQAYIAAGASGFFIPGINDTGLIQNICEAVSSPVNVMAGSVDAQMTMMKDTDVSRISYGPHPFFKASQLFEEAAKEAFSA